VPPRTTVPLHQSIIRFLNDGELIQLRGLI
jgi:hypothetical protein